MSIKISNFSIGIEEWVKVSDLYYFSVDVTDSVNGINAANTYFTHDGDTVITTYTGISDGYRFYYSPSSVASSGIIDLTINAENNVGDNRDQSFHFYYGYNVVFEDLIDWGPNTEVISTLQAKNSVFCPNTEAESFYFVTGDGTYLNLGASIVVVGSVDLGATIYPQNTFFFYGRTYTVTVSGVKDYEGNEMSPYTFSFRIENPT